jgi:hypothetical protein
MGWTKLARLNDVVPILQQRGLFHRDYMGVTLRGHLGAPAQYGVDPRIMPSSTIQLCPSGRCIEPALGKVNTIVGSGVAKIIVDDTTFRGVTLC